MPDYRWSFRRYSLTLAFFHPLQAAEYRIPMTLQSAERLTAGSHPPGGSAASTRSTSCMGIPRLTVSKILNHVEPGVTAVYDRHSYDREKREALEQWALRLRIIVSGLREVEAEEATP